LAYPDTVRADHGRSPRILAGKGIKDSSGLNARGLKTLITGASGFVGRKLAESERKRGYEVVGLHDPKESPELDFESHGVDIKDAVEVRSFVEKINPSSVFHLAALSSVRICQENPSACFDVNVKGTFNLLDSLSSTGSEIRVVFSSSCEVYGYVESDKQPVKETYMPKPVNVYGLSKLLAEKICFFYSKKIPDNEKKKYDSDTIDETRTSQKGLEVMTARSFNHTGPGQEQRFVFPYVARTLARIEKGIEEPLLRMGNLGTRRDILDVRDVVKAYTAIMDKGQAGNIYNVTSSRCVSIEEGVRMLIEISKLNVKIQQEESRMRSYDIPELHGDATLANIDLGWRSELTLEETMKDLLQYWRAKEGVI
jgi:GDP-4-dehydro-6-deoxy-D-mannose reductase